MSTSSWMTLRNLSVALMCLGQGLAEVASPLGGPDVDSGPRLAGRSLVSSIGPPDPEFVPSWKDW